MHPALAVWIWMMAMARAWQGPFTVGISSSEKDPERLTRRTGHSAQPMFVRASEYLHSDVAQNPLPDKLLDRLADLYWTERDAELGV